jgi:transcriptional regulator with XRE-family HTH domain
METIPMDTVPAEVGPRLRHFRKRAGLSPEKAGLETGLSARVIGDFERGYRVPRLAYLRVLADLYQVPITELVDAEVITR